MHEEETTIIVASTKDGDEKQVTESRRKLVKEIQSRVSNAKSHFKREFEQMRRDMDLAYHGFDKRIWDDNKYVANIIQRHVQQRTAALYAKNPRAISKRRPRKDYLIYDGDQEALAASKAAIQVAKENMLAPPVEAVALVQDFQAVERQRKMLDNVSESLEFLFHYFMDEQQPSFKAQMKSLVRRVITTGVGFVKVGFQRDVDRSPEVTAKLADAQARLDHLRRLAQETAEGEHGLDSAEVEELRLSVESLMKEPMIVIREGLVFDFPESTSVIVDPMCRQLSGFVGARWCAHELYLTPEEVKEIYGCDVSKKYTKYDVGGNQTDDYSNRLRGTNGDDTKEEGLCLVHEVYDKPSGLVYVVCDGYKDFLKPPAAPDVHVEGFWPFHALVFNETEHRDKIYPRSDVDLLSPMQHEYNRARQGLREHRRANRPKYAAPAGMLEPEDKAKLKDHPANALIELQALATGQKVNDVIQPVQQIGIDPNLYEVRSIFDDVQLVGGAQEANYGGVSKATATETSIAESARMSSLGAQIDELDSFMSNVTRTAGQVLLLEMSQEQVQRICGPGAVWPELSREQIMEEVFLEIEAGSTGKPNRAAELRNIERIMPFLIQIPNIDPQWLAKELIKRLDDKLDVEEAIRVNMPSVISQNSAMQPGTGDPATNPAAQGGQGANNAPIQRGLASPNSQMDS